MSTQTLITSSPGPTDTTVSDFVKMEEVKLTFNFHFKLVKRLEVCSYGDEKHTFVNLLAVSNAYGLTFIGATNGFYVLKTDSIYEGACQKKFIQVNSRVTHLAVSCDDSYLAVGVLSDKTCVALIYANESLVKQDVFSPLHKVTLSSTPAVSMVEMVWNPAVPNLFSSCLTDGSVQLAQIDSPISCSSLPAAAAARCLCWSPKGKQFVVGSEDGKLTQYRPDLKPAKALPAPPLHSGNVAVVSVFWVSNFQFAAYYRDRNDHNAPQVLLIINAEKNQPVTFINYEDVTFGGNSVRNVLFISSANSTEVAVLSLEALEQANTWRQWFVGDSSRVEMPLSSTQDETFPLGMAVDLSSQSVVPWGENNLAPMPRLMLLSSEGKLCAYNVIGLMAAAQPICAPPAITLPDSIFDAPLPPAIVPPTEPPSPSDSLKANAQVEYSSTPTFSPTDVHTENQVSSNAFPPNLEVSKIPAQSEQVYEQVLESTYVDESNNDPEPDESVIESAILDEMLAIEEDLQALLQSLQFDDSLNLGQAEEFSDCVRRVGDLTEYSKKVEEATYSQAEEVGELKLDTLEMRARVEDASLMVKRSNSQICTKLHRSGHVDPYTSRTLKDILSLRTYIDSQITLISDHLDQQWENYQRSCRKDAKSFMKNPFMEDVLKTLTIQKKLIAHHKGQLDQIQKSLEQSSMQSLIAASTKNDLSSNLSAIHNKTLEFSKLADSFLGLSMQDKGEKFKTDDLISLVKDKKIQEAKMSELSARELTALLDRFEDAQVPIVSQVLRFSEREACRKKIAERMKMALERAKKERISAAKSRENVPLPEMTMMNFSQSFSQPNPIDLKKEAKPVHIEEPPKVELNANSFTFSGANLKPEASSQQINISSGANKEKENKPTFPAFGSSVGGTGTSAFSPLSGNLFDGSTTSAFLTPSTNKPSTVSPFTTTKFSFSTTGALSFNSAIGSQSSQSVITSNPIPSVTTSNPLPTLPSGVTITPIFSPTASSDLPIKPAVVTEATSSEKQTSTVFQTAAKVAPQSAESKPAAPTSEVPFFAGKSPTSAPQNISGFTIGQVAPRPQLSFGLGSKNDEKVQPFGTPKNEPRENQEFKFSLNKEASPVTKGLESTATGPVTSGIFGSSTQNSSFGDALKITPSSRADLIISPKTTTASGEGVSSSSPVTSGPPVAAAAAPTATTTTASTSPGLFSSAASAAATKSPLPVSVASSIFGSATPPTTQTTSNIFGAQSQSLFQSTPTTKVSSLFDVSAVKTTPSLFGGSTAVSTSLLGSPSTTTAQTSSVASPTNTANIFGGSFGQANTTGANIFAPPANAPTTISAEVNLTANLFGQVLGGSSSPATSPPANIFGTVTPTKPLFDSSSNIFASAAPSSTASIFGASSTNVFGAKPPTLFGSTTNAFTPPSNPNPIFGGSPFGANTAAQGFGQTKQAAPTAFAGATPPAQNQSIFGSSTSAFGSNQPVSSATSIFGGGAFSNNAFSGSGFGGVSSSSPQSAFGSAPIFSNPAGTFGSAPVFDNNSKSGPAFGGSATFGGASVFGSPQKVFGSPNSSNNTFGQSPGFEAASQSNVGFANLAQQQSGFGSGFGTPQAQQQPSTFGGSSFSSWR